MVTRLQELRRIAQELGVDAESVARAEDEPTLFGAIIDALVLGERTLTLTDAARAARADAELARDVWAALGNPEPGPALALTEADADTLAFFDLAHSILGWEGAVSLARELGVAAERLADSIVAALQFVMEWPRPAGETPRADLARFYAQLVPDILPRFERATNAALRRRLAGAVPYDWSRNERGVLPSDVAVCAIRHEGERPTGAGFVRPTRDGSLWTSGSVDDACGLARRAVADGAAGIAWGGVSTRRGEACGPTVNTAVRLSRMASCGEVLVTQDAARAAPRQRFEATELRVFVGVDGHSDVCRLAG